VIPLPVDSVLPALVSALTERGVAVLRAPTGAGKTSRVPPAILAGGVAGEGQIFLLQPRRIAARAAARRMAQEHGSRVGARYGYQVRFERKTSAETRVIAMTPGILLRRFHQDPFLEGCGAIVLDEFHERSVEADLVLGMARLLRETLRPELRLVVMSATIDAEPIAAWLGDAPILACEGRLHPVKIENRGRRSDERLEDHVTLAVRDLLQEETGDILVFLPGVGEIRRCQRALEALPEADGVELRALYGDLPAGEQDGALRRARRRRVILATNVAESSVTVEGITAVVDSGLHRRMSFDAGLGLGRLELRPVCRASADQRAGRAGRLQPGRCIRLWSRADDRGRPAHDEPEIRRSDPSALLLQLHALGEAESFSWFEAPRESAIEGAERLLRRLGALDEDGRLSALGKRLAELPLAPRLGRLLLAGEALGPALCDRIALAAALLSERDPIRPKFPPDPNPTPSPSDLLDRIEALERFERRASPDRSLGQLDRGGARSILRVRKQLRGHMKPKAGVEAELCPDEAVQRALLAAFPDRVIRRREARGRRGVMVGGRGVKLAPGSRVVEGELFLGLDIDLRSGDALVRSASLIEEEWLDPLRCELDLVLSFDEEKERVRARRERRYDGLVLESSTAPLPKHDAGVADCLARAARERLAGALPDENSAYAKLCRRLGFLRAHCPELEFPSEESLVELLLPVLCQGLSSFAELRRAPWEPSVRGSLSQAQREALEREAPERYPLPTGSSVALRYEAGRPPVLAARIQQLFGLNQSPSLARGRAPLLLHLLAPNNRPQQITDDLPGFWVRTYPQVRRDLRARYPKHSWPDDPLSAAPEDRPRRRRK